jgi:methylated-DNA-protein-cysteine methyltransferase-like protein
MHPKRCIRHILSYMEYGTKNSSESKKCLLVGAMISFYEHVYVLVRQIPPGTVVTYGQVAALLGAPRAARAVGYALRFLPAGTDVPWHRVINHRGQISPRTPIEGPLLQRLLLEEEGVMFDAEGRVDLSIYRWQR